MIVISGERAPDRVNALVHERSPYLLEHASNPVDWYPWREEAFQKARDEDKPIFLSIGYSTCHWCHVMARESFEDPEVARLMNEAFVNIKVDREERPDIDRIYMTVCQLMTGQGGWPLNVLMTPSREPFFAATYIPKEARFGRKGMMDLIPRVRELWDQDREEITRSAENVTDALQQAFRSSPAGELSEFHLNSAYRQLAERFDEQNGGFGGAPKFPTPHTLIFLLRVWHRTREDRALHMVEQTLEALRAGGIHDHLGLGFHRYATDAEWRLPHFEKMLYDQAMLAMAYIEGYLATGRGEFERTARDVFTYVLRDLTGPEGGFYSAEDADSEGEEGKYYLWTEDEIRSALGEGRAELALKAFQVEREGNFTEEPSRRKTGRNVLHLRDPNELAAELAMSREALRTELNAIRALLFEARERRPHPKKDDKILVDWNGLMIAALAKGAATFDEPAYREAARSAADFILEEMIDPRGRLLHRHREGEAAILGFIDDYASLIWGLIELYQATFEERYLQAALELNDSALERFWDEDKGGFYSSAHDAEALLVRTKEFTDGALPSGNSVALLNLLRLARITGNPRLEQRTSELSGAASESALQIPTGHTHLFTSLAFGLGPSHEVVIADAPGAHDTGEMLKALRSRFIPHTVVLLRPVEGEEEPQITRLAPFTRELTGRDGNATAYVCRNHECDLPTTEVPQMLELLGAENDT